MRVFLPYLRSNVSLQEAVKASQGKVAALARTADHDQSPAYWDEVLGLACLTECQAGAAPVAATQPLAASASISDEAVMAMIDASMSAELLASLIAGLPDGPMKEHAKARAEALKATAAPK